MTLIPKRTAEEINKGNAYLLANMALKCLENPQSAPDNEVGLNNVYRMIRAYKMDILQFPDLFYGRDYLKIHDALEGSSAVAFPNKRRDEVVCDIVDVLVDLVKPNEFEMPSKGTKDRTKKFFRELQSRLREA